MIDPAEHPLDGLPGSLPAPGDPVHAALALIYRAVTTGIREQYRRSIRLEARLVELTEEVSRLSEAVGKGGR